MSKLKVLLFCKIKAKSSTFPLLLDKNNSPLTSDFNKASCFNKSFQKVFSKVYEAEHFKLIDKNFPEKLDFLQ